MSQQKASFDEQATKDEKDTVDGQCSIAWNYITNIEAAELAE